MINARQIHFGHVILLVLILLLCSLLVYYPLRGTQSGKYFEEVKSGKFEKFQLKDIVRRRYNQFGDIILVFRADEIIHRRVKFGPFTFSPLTEIAINNLGVEIVQPRPGSDKLRNKSTECEIDIFCSIADTIKGQLYRSWTKQVSKVTIGTFDLTVLRDDKRLFTLRAHKVSLWPLSPSTVWFEKFSFISSDGDQVITENAVWSNENKRFILANNFSRKKNNSLTPGTGFVFAVDENGIIQEDKAGSAN